MKTKSKTPRWLLTPEVSKGHLALFASSILAIGLAPSGQAAITIHNLLGLGMEIDNSRPTTNLVNEQYMRASSSGHTMLFVLDLSTLPSGSTIVSVTPELELVFGSASSLTFQLGREFDFTGVSAGEYGVLDPLNPTSLEQLFQKELGSPGFLYLEARSATPVAAYGTMWSLNNNQLSLAPNFRVEVQGIPEPTATLLAAVGVLGLFRRRR